MAARHVAAVIEGIDLADALDFVDRAGGTRAFRQLEAHLADNPDSLVSGSSDAPIPVQRLAELLSEASHSTVVVPRCLRCGKPKQLRHIVPGGRACESCYLHFRHRAQCSRCGRDRPVRGKDEQQRPLCATCCRGRKVENCGACGRLLRVAARRDDGAALCPNCYHAPESRCHSCERTAPTYAHTDEGPICKGCYQRPKRRCGACGDVRGIDCRADAGEPDICGRCRARRKRACLICGTLYPANPLARQPVCLPCRDAGHILEPDLAEPADRTRRRAHETIHDALRHKLSDLLTHPDHGIADQLAPLIGVFDTVPRPANVMNWLQKRGSGPRLLRELALRAHTEPITHELLDGYPQGYALHRARDLLVHAGILPERTELLDRIDVWLDNLLREQPEHHAKLLRPFTSWQALRRARNRARHRPITRNAATYVRSQVTIALDFLTWLDAHGKTLDTATQADLDRWLDTGTQTNYFLSTFIDWAKKRGLCDLTVPSRPGTEPDTFLGEDDRWSTLRRCLHNASLPLDIRAAGILVLLFGRTTTSFAHLTVTDLERIDAETYLRLGDFTALLPPAAAAIFHALADATTGRETFHRAEPHARYLFPGRSPGRPAASHILARKLRAHGISTLSSRNSARAAWAREIPGPIAADLLGIDINTATRWAQRTRRDWTDYLATRAADQTRAIQ
ncbi:hypothetical protein [Nocardia yunnanensis]|nr:hypothetical protein [Nocardia yunnanensis]